MGGMGLILTHVLIRWLLSLLGLSGSRIALPVLVAPVNSPIGRYDSPPMAHLPTPPTQPPPSHPPLIHAICDYTIRCEKVIQIQQC